VDSCVVTFVQHNGHLCFLAMVIYIYFCYYVFMNMFKKVKANSVESYLAAVPKERKEDFLFLHKFIQKTVPKLKTHFAYNMLGYGSFSAKNHKKEPIEWPVISLANQKNYISLYICAVEDGKYIAEKNKKDLGNVSVGKSCIRIKKIEDVNLPALKKVLLLAQKNPGLAGVGAKNK
jgi:hypothetical protein